MGRRRNLNKGLTNTRREDQTNKQTKKSPETKKHPTPRQKANQATKTGRGSHLTASVCHLRAKLPSTRVSWEPSSSRNFAATSHTPRPSLGFPVYASEGTHAWSFLEARLLHLSGLCRVWSLEKKIGSCLQLPPWEKLRKFTASLGTFAEIMLSETS